MIVFWRNRRVFDHEEMTLYCSLSFPCIVPGRASEEKCQELEERNTQLEDELLQTQEKLRALERTSGTPRVTPQPDAPQKTPSPAPLVKDIPQESAERSPSGTKSPGAGSKTPAKASPTPPQTPRSQSQRPPSQASGRSATSSRASSRSKKSKWFIYLWNSSGCRYTKKVKFFHCDILVQLFECS